MAQRVIAYIDGFNLYFGLKAMGWRRYYWLDLFKLSRNLLKTNQELVAVKYFTARISAGDKSTPPGIKQIMEAKRRRQRPCAAGSGAEGKIPGQASRGSFSAGPRLRAFEKRGERLFRNR